MLLSPVAQSIQDDARLNACKFLLNVYFENLIHVLRKVEDHRDVATLARQTGARSPRQYRRAEFSTRRDCGNYVGIIKRNYQPDRNLTVI
jgi:hypothetical protein